MAILDEDIDVAALVATAEADVVQPSAVAQCHLAVGVDGVVAHPVVGLVEGDARGPCPGPAGVDLLGSPATQGAVGSDGVVVAGEVVELGLQAPHRRCPWPGAQPALEALVEALDLAAGLRVVGPGVTEGDAPGVEGQLQGHSGGVAVATRVDGAVV